MKDDPEFNISFVSMVRQFPCLYDNTSLDYSNKTLQLKAWETIASQVNESVLDCKDRWKNLRGCFTRHLKNKSGEASGHRYRKPYYLAQHLNFLLPFTKSRLLVSNEVCDGFQNEDDDTIVDDDGDDNNNYNSTGVEEANGDEGNEDFEELNQGEDRVDQDETRVLTKRIIKTEPFTETNKWQANSVKRVRVDRQAIDDSDMYFLKSILPDMRAMDGSQKRRLKIGILQLCEDILNESVDATELLKLIVRQTIRASALLGAATSLRTGGVPAKSAETRFVCAPRSFEKRTSEREVEKQSESEIPAASIKEKRIDYSRLGNAAHVTPHEERRSFMEMENKSDEWNKKFLETLLYSNSERLVVKANDKGKNPFIWSQFQIAYIDGVEQKYACCNFCKTFIKYTGRTGTGGLMRHLCFRRLNAVKYMRNRKKPNEDKDSGSKLARNTCVRLKLENMMHRNSPRIGYVPNAKGKSKIWSQFRIITVDNALSKFACCMLCRSIVTYTGRTGTGSMVRHKCSRNKYQKRLDADEDVDQVIDPIYTVIKSEESFDWDEKDVSDLETDVNRTSPPPIAEGDSEAKVEEQSGVPPEVKRIIMEKHTALMNRSLQLFENEEFLELAQFLVHLGAQYGPVDVKDIFRRKMNLLPFNEG